VTVVTLYTRPGCHLCDEARAVIASLRDSHGPFELREVDIECAPELHARFLERIPVVEVDGEPISELHVDPQALSDALAAGTGTVRAMTNEATREPR
jgi:glutathione S-transferase